MTAAARPATRPPLGLVAALIVGVVAWGGLLWVAMGLLAADPPRAGDDLALLLRAGRDLANGRSPYDAAILAGGSPAATELFYSYPPPVGQAMQLLAGLPLTVLLGGLALAAAAGLAVVAAALRRALAPDVPARSVILGTLAAAPLVLPFGIAILFGNLDALFPFGYGAALLGALGASRWPGVGGMALALAAIAKLYPAGLGLWFVVRAVRDRARAVRPSAAASVVLAALLTALAVVALSVGLGGSQPWVDWSTVARVVAGAEIVDPRNLGPAAQLALVLGADESAARMIHVGVLALAILATVLAAWRIDDPVAGLSIAATATLVLLPVTWYHYHAALIPFGVAALLRDPSPRTTALVASAGVLATIGIALPALLWAGVAVLLVATSRAGTSAARVTGGLRTAA